MNINKLIEIIKSKIEAEIIVQDFQIEDKTFLHKNHKGNQEGMFHLKLIIKSEELKKLNKIESTKKIYSILDLELKEYIHSIQILLS
jgi:BolA family transcriptional regulator, general stress-responsive regulator